MVATKRDPQVQMAAPYQAQRRVTRSPRYTFNVETRPFALTPFMIAPVLPGETLTNLVLQNRVVTDPVKHPLIGWWAEHWFFYVKHRDLVGRADFAEMMLNPTKDMSAYNSAADAAYFHAGGINWLKLCMEVITKEYFRDEGEDWDVATLSGYPELQIVGNSVLDSLTPHAAKRALDVPADVDGDGTVEASELDMAYAQWQAMRDAGLMPMDYEDFLRSYGVKSVRQEETSPELHRPELLRHVRTWSYPTNTIDPSDGTPRSAVSWSVAERADKDRFFKEPGFVIGLMGVRSKVYLDNQIGSFVGGMNSAIEWLPAVLNDHPELSYMQYATGAGPLPTLTDAGGYWVDIRDLFVHGEQFSNIATPGSPVALPTVSGSRRYPASADVDALFVNVAKNKVKMDGVVSVSVKGRQVDHTPNIKL